ncbi:hypothetical protein BHAP_1329 [Bifidobacterium hapali]|uniref:Protein ylxX/ylxW n=1 Tax=Bifidobacterium hapali TaxID=1630172 RepID=A0A261FYB5_9BIFI|nr:DUF881 domain-containing protein [Bifidobacterium hapali]OZG64162.1 hypothetical protein BHAP_1329 [Bifidobacterium hapali]
MDNNPRIFASSAQPLSDSSDVQQQALPESFPVNEESASVRRRAVFSDSIAGIISHHASLSADVGQASRRHRRKAHDGSLQLLDDLTNRPMDPLFSDSRLATQRNVPAWERYITRVSVFILCVIVGFYSCLFVQQLHTDPRKAVRQNWASELEELNAQVDTLNSDVSDLQSQVTNQSKQLGDITQSDTLVQDEMTNGLSRVKGEGITLTLANPIASDTSSSDGTYHRDTTAAQIRLVSDLDLQLFVSLLWRSGAEAIAINGYRIGVQTSIRTAGQTIMVGVNPVQSPYRIEAIGERSALAEAVSAKQQPQLYDSLSDAGIYPQVSKSRSLTLEAASIGNLSYTRKGE